MGISLRGSYMQILIATELIFGAVFVVVFWFTNLEMQLARGFRQRPLNPYGDEWNDDPDGGVDHRLSAVRIRVHGQT